MNPDFDIRRAKSQSGGKLQRFLQKKCGYKLKSMFTNLQASEEMLHSVAGPQLSDTARRVIKTHFWLSFFTHKATAA